MIQAAKEAQVLAAGEPGIEAVVGAGVIAEPAADGAGFSRGIVAGDPRGTARREEKRGQNAQECGLAGSIGANKGQSFAFSYFEGDTGERNDRGFFERLNESAPATASRREGFLKGIDGDGGFSH